ncbi:MAG TPA: hypothetical protein PLD59_10705 [Tepidisphaeraceae bacterium]|nr:hypothetical protein [Tepidisphaeraceae bacterium]
MKNATKHADALKSYFKKLVKQHEVPELTPMEPLRALVMGCLSFDTSDARTEEAIKVIETEFVDLNELRVATELEVLEMIGSRMPDLESRVSMFITSLNAIFAREHSLGLERVRALPKREIRQFFRELPGMNPFVDAYIMLYGFDTHAFPVDSGTLQTLIAEDLLEEQTTIDEAQKFVEHHLKDDECYKLYWCMRHAKKRK